MLALLAAAAGWMALAAAARCTKQAKQYSGVTLASCYGPVMESPWTGNHVVPGETAFTQAPVGASYPVGGNVP
jgi:hypothetical protein